MVSSWADQLLPQLLMEQIDIAPTQCRHTDYMHEGIWLRKKKFEKIDSCENLEDNFFPNRAFVYALMVPSWADQILSQLLMEQVDTLPSQFRHTEHMHKGVWFRKNHF